MYEFKSKIFKKSKVPANDHSKASISRFLDEFDSET